MIDSTAHGGSSGPGRIRQLNREAVLRHIRLHGPSARTSLMRALKLSAAAVSSVVSELLNDGLLTETESPPTTGRLGRPVSLLELRPNAGFALGLLLRPRSGRVHVESAWADYAGGVEVAPVLTVESTADPQALIDRICEAVTVLEGTVPEARHINSVVVGIPGVVDDDRRIPIAPRLKSIEGTAFMDTLRSRIAYPLHFQNDINLAVLAELDRQRRLRSLNFAYLFIASGVGVGIGLRGRLWAGSGWAGEVGQLRITRGRGRRESFEELLGTDNDLARQMTELGLAPDGLDQLVEAVDARDRRALRVVQRYAENLCDLVQVLNAVLDLDEVIVDFPSHSLLERLVPRVETIMADSSLRVRLSEPSIGHAAGVCGAALAALGLSLGTVQRRETA